MTPSAPGMLLCDHAKAVEEMSRGLELITQLRAIVLPSPPTDRRSELVRDLFEDILQSFALVLSKLRPCCHSPIAAKLGSPYSGDDHRGKVSVGKRTTPEEREKGDGHKRRRQQGLWTTVRSVPYIDGYQWRKYGQKQIHNAKFPRSYYRCTNYKDQGCLAKKTVQQMDGNDDPPKFEVTYSMHTCKTIEISSPFVMDSAPIKTSAFGLESLVAPNKTQDVSSPIIGFDLKELPESLTPVDTPRMEDMIVPNMPSPMTPYDFGPEWAMIEACVGLSEANNFDEGSLL